ncbi:MAG: tetratricopeptide repeat protein [Mariprofundus sp.]|nr:tetratricopeptide repeat protein [Mariprofundus sp.]
MAAAREAIKQGDLAQAEHLLTELLEFAPVEIKAWKLLAKTQRHLGHIEAGINSAMRALRLQNTDIEAVPLASITIAQLLWDQHEYDEAKRMIALLLEQQPDNAEYFDLQQQWNMEQTT